LLRIADFRALRQDESERSLAYGYDAELRLGAHPEFGLDRHDGADDPCPAHSLAFATCEFEPDDVRSLLFIGDSFVWARCEAGERFTDLPARPAPAVSDRERRRVRLRNRPEYLWLQRIWDSVRRRPS